ncbi:hypothetical protein LCGC14_1499220 [marine sediment metagenome]|uniref:Uncharacterized protein n=1 Tax=marine sediment metagenome TaxID=412755 RepID=A0A0F9J4I1_9ZZZZ
MESFNEKLSSLKTEMVMTENANKYLQKENKKLEDKNKILYQWIIDYGKHYIHCSYMKRKNGKCNCRLHNILDNNQKDK